MSALPGRRHRTLAPTSILREGDVAAMEAANAALRSGAHGPFEMSIDILGGRRLVGQWPSGGEEKITAYAAADVVIFDLPLWQGDVISAIDIWTWQAVAAKPVTITLETRRARESSSDLVASVSQDLPITQWARCSLGLISGRLGRPLGWRIPQSIAVPTLRIVAGSAGDQVQGIVLWFERPPQ